MSVIVNRDMNYFNREDDGLIESKLLSLATESSALELIISGESGVGKTCFVNHAIKEILDNESFDKFQVIYYDVTEYGTDFDREKFYNTLIYKTLFEKNPSLRNLTKINKNCTFLSFLEKTNCQNEIKENIKKSLVAALSLIPHIGSAISNIFSIESKEYKQIYFDNSNYFFEYIKEISKTGLILVFDNAHVFPSHIFNELESGVTKESPIAVIFINSIDKGENLTHEKITAQKIFSNSIVISVDKLSIHSFDTICNTEFNKKTYQEFKKKINKYYELVEYGNFRLIDEFIFRATNKGLDSVKDSPLLENIYEMDEVKQNILNLLEIISNGVSKNLIMKIIRFNDLCTEEKIENGLAELISSKYITQLENNMFSLEHNKIREATTELQLIDENSDRREDLYQSCRTILTSEIYNDITDCDFVFCISELLQIYDQLDILTHIGAIAKYINILDMNYRYTDICMLIEKLIQKSNYSSVIVLFPISSILKILNAFQKSSNFKQGAKLAKEVSYYYNINMYQAKFQVQMYDYTGAKKLIENNLNCFEAYSIYINSLQHLREDPKARELVLKIVDQKDLYLDKEFYYIILRNSGHLVDYNTGLLNLQQCIEFFMSSNNSFVLSTCYNNIGLIHLYNYVNNTNDIKIARNYFSKAKQTMQDLHSNEEYQSAFNIGLSYMCENRYDVAMRFFEQALQLVPSELEFDIKKFLCTQYVCKMLKMEISPTECRNFLNNKYIEVEMHTDPWLKYMYDYNLESIDSIIHMRESNHSNIINDYSGDPDIYGVKYTCKYNGNDKSFILAPSPHWRY